MNTSTTENDEKLKAEFNSLRKWTHVTELLGGSKFVTRKKDAHSQLSAWLFLHRRTQTNNPDL